MDTGTVAELLSTQHHAILATTRADGTLQMSPVLVALDEQGRCLISTRETAYKTHNVRRDPTVYVCVIPDQFFGQWVQLDGTAEVVSLPEAMDLLVEYYRLVSGEHADWDEYRAAMERDRRVALRIEITRIGPDKHG